MIYCMGLPPEDERAVQKATPSLGVTVSYFRYGLASVPGITKVIRPVGRHIDILSLLVYEENRQFAGIGMHRYTRGIFGTFGKLSSDFLWRCSERRIRLRQPQRWKI